MCGHARAIEREREEVPYNYVYYCKNMCKQKFSLRKPSYLTSLLFPFRALNFLHLPFLQQYASCKTTAGNNLWLGRSIWDGVGWMDTLRVTCSCRIVTNAAKHCNKELLYVSKTPSMALPSRLSKNICPQIWRLKRCAGGGLKKQLQCCFRQP